MDEAIGEVVNAIKAKGMWDNTLVVFSSDNGGPVYEPGSANNHPLKGGKYSDWEGGVRVNAWVSGGFVPKAKRGSTYSGVMSIADWYGTFCELAGVDATDHASAKANEWLKEKNLPLLPPVDSVPMWGFLMNGTNGRPTLHLSAQAVLQYPYKIIVGKQGYSRWTGELYPNCTTIDVFNADQGPFFQDLNVFDHTLFGAVREESLDRITWTDDCGAGCLFNVEKDPTEHVDLARDLAHQDIFKRLAAELKTLNEGNFDPSRGVTSADACMKCVDNGGYYGPFVDAADWYTPLPARTPGEHQKDETLKKTLQVINNKILEEGIAKAAQVVLPFFRNAWGKTLDKCFAVNQEIVV